MGVEKLSEKEGTVMTKKYKVVVAGAGPGGCERKTGTAAPFFDSSQ
jgi:hypothetical protein